MSPLGLHILLHLYCNGEEYDFNQSPADQNLKAQFMQRELITDDICKKFSPHTGTKIGLTPKGRFYVDYILATPEPTVKFTIPARKRK